MKPVLSFNDPRVKKLWNTHACLCKRGNEFKFHLLDNLPDRDVWQRVGVIRIARSGMTISESLVVANQELKNVRIIKRQNVVRR